jgi:predicted MFS family arabinose efflux permease
MTNAPLSASAGCEPFAECHNQTAGSPHWVLGRRASLFVSIGVVTHTLWTSAAPALTYRLYAQEWHLSHTTTATIFAIYPLVVVAVLLSLGDLSDHIGRRSTMLLGLIASLIGALCFAIAPDVAWLFAGRMFMGIGVGLTAGPSTAAVLEFTARGDAQRAATMTTVAQAAGFASALLIGGVLIEYAPLPTRLNFWTLCIVLFILVIGTSFLPNRSVAKTARRWRLKLPVIPRGLRKTFLVASIAVATGYTHGVLILSLGGQVVHDLVGSSNALINGAALSLFAVVSGIGGIFARNLPFRSSMIAGAAASAAAMGLFSVAVAEHDLVFFLAAMAVAGVGYSLLVRGGLELIALTAPAAHRAGILSALYLLAYLSLGATAILLGAVATSWGLGIAANLGAVVVALLGVVTVALVSSQRMTRVPA